MSFSPEMPEDATLANIFGKYTDTSVPLLRFHEALLRAEGPLSIADRELIAAYVSGLNQCGYSQGVHTKVAVNFGVEEGLLDDLLEDVDSAAIPENMKPLLRYVKKLTETPSRMKQLDADAVFEAGWDESAFYCAVSVCALFNLVNRLVLGFGFAGDDDMASIRGKLLHDNGYEGLIRMMGLPDHPVARG